MKGYLATSIIPDENNIYLSGNKIKGNSYANLGWKNNLSVQKVLDVLVSIMVEEYIEVARGNREIFMDSRFRGNDTKNDGGERG